MLDVSPLRRAAEQPPCDSSAEALCLNGVFAVPARMDHFDLGPHLLFVEHRAIWRSMLNAQGDADGFWLRVFRDLAREQCPPACAPRHDSRACGTWRVLNVLAWSPYMVADDSDEGALIFTLALKKLERCTEARRVGHVAQSIAEAAWRVPEHPFDLGQAISMLDRLRAPARVRPTIRIDVA